MSTAPAGVTAEVPTGFKPPPYPYERLNSLREAAAALEGGMVDLSVGSPCDPPSPAVLAALAGADEGGATRGYPSSAGSLVARAAAVGLDEPAPGRRASTPAASRCASAPKSW